MTSRNIALLIGTAVIVAALVFSVGSIWRNHVDIQSNLSEEAHPIIKDFLVPVVPFTNIAKLALSEGHEIWNDRPGVVVFDYDRDGDHDFYVTSELGEPNHLYNNQGNGQFIDVAIAAGVGAKQHNNTGVVACDINNDGYQDLYVGAWGLVGDRLDFRSHVEDKFSKDLLFLNNKNGTFRDISDSAFGTAVNFRSATTIACADVNSDGWLDIYVANLLDDDFRFLSTSHAGHFNTLYINERDLTFSDQSFVAGVQGPQIVLRDNEGHPIVFVDPDSGTEYEGYDHSMRDVEGNRIGDPTGQTHSVLFFDYDEDNDPDLWLANDGDRLHIYRNDSTPSNVEFVLVSQGTPIAKAGAWMGFAIGDYDGDHDLDVFVTNMGYHPRLRPPLDKANGTCEYHDQFDWGTCLHFMLKNTHESAENSSALDFYDVAAETYVDPNRYMPPYSLNQSNIHETQQVPKGLAAYDFGFGATFFDIENDGDQDLYWLGSTIARGRGPGGALYPSAGRMLRGDGKGRFQDITVEAHVLNIAGVRYDLLTEDFEPASLGINPMLHENGKGLAHGDFNNDGYVDLVGTNSSGPEYDEFPPAKNTGVTPKPGPIFLWLNGGGENNWITLRLQGRMAIDGTGTNADGIGAKVLITTTHRNRDEPLVQLQEVRAGSSYLSMDSVELEFGLLDAIVVDEVRIFWPSGRIQILNNVPVNQQHLLVEPQGN